MNVLTAVQLSKDVDAQLIVDAASRPAKGFARWRERTSWPWKLLLAWCITASRPCTRSVNWEATLCPRAFSIFENLSFGALSDEMKLDVWFVQVRRLALFEGWFTKIWPVDGFCSFGQRAKAAPGKSHGICLGQPHALAQLEDSALRSAEKSVVQCRKHIVLDPNGMSEDVAGRRG